MSLSRRRFVHTVGAGAAGLWVAGRGREAGLFDLSERAFAAETTPILLSSNENPLGPSPRAIAAVKREAARIHLYPDGGSTASFARRCNIGRSSP